MTSLPPFDYQIVDTFANYDTRSLLCGRAFTNYHKHILLEVIRYYAYKSFKGSTETEQTIIKYIQAVFDSNPNITYEDLMKLLHAKSNECMLAYILVAYNNDNIDIILRCMYTFCRVLPFNTKTEWYDNYRLNNYGNPLNMIMWHDYDCDDVYTLSAPFPNDIDNSVSLNFNKVVKRLVGSLRAFVIDHELYPNSVKSNGIKGGTSLHTSAQTLKDNHSRSVSVKSTSPLVVKHKRILKNTHSLPSALSTHQSFVNTRYKRRHERLTTRFTGGDIESYTSDRPTTPFRSGKNDSLSRNLTAEQICDECYTHYPYFFGGAHGCDVFDTYLTLSIEELTLFFKRYPSAKVGYILNTGTYASGDGEHWVALELSQGQAKLICSQGSGFGSFHDNGKLDRELQRNMYGQRHNIVHFQTDSYSCGIFSALSLYELLMTNSIEASVAKIGTNGESLAKGKDINDIRELWAGTK